MTAGVLDPKEYIPILRDELKAVGVDEVVAFYQSEHDVWVAAK